MYGGALAADSLHAYLQTRLGVAAAPFRVRVAALSDKPQHTDDDMARTLNLLGTPPPEQLAYPLLEPLPAPAGLPAKPKPNLLLIADSFGWTWITNDFFKHSFSEQSRFWYYNNEVAWPGADLTPEGRNLWQLKTKEQYLARDIIVVMYNEMNLHQYDHGFTNELYNIFHPYTAAENARHAALVRELRQKAAWEEAAQEGFETRLREQASAVLDRDR